MAEGATNVVRQQPLSPLRKQDSAAKGRIAVYHAQSPQKKQMATDRKNYQVASSPNHSHTVASVE